VVAWDWRESVSIGWHSLAAVLRLPWLTGSTKLIIIGRGFFTYSFWQVTVVLLLFRLQLVRKLLHAELLFNSKLWKLIFLFFTSKLIIADIIMILIILYSISRRLAFLSFHLDHKNQKDQNTAAK